MNIYIHIPFCVSKCAYCAFLSHSDLAFEDKYIEAVCSEIKQSDLTGFGKIETVYFGGGTPSLIAPASIERIIKGLAKNSSFADDVEITLESNPSDISKEKLKAWKDAGLTRLSIGVQSINDVVRRAVGRNLPSESVIKKLALAKKYFKDVGADLICGLPGETKDSLLLGIDAITSLGLSHISLYDLETKNESEIAMNPNKFTLPNDEEASEMLVAAWKRLAELGYEQYEISNFAKEGHYCRHNLDFWHGKDYLGFGLGAVSRVGNKVIENTKDFCKYCDGENTKNTEILSKSEIFSAQIMSIMRLSEPLNTKTLSGLTDVLIEAKKEKLIGIDNKVTLKGKLFNNYLVKKFVKNA